MRVHVSGIDLIRDEQGAFRVLEDNVRVPSGVSYVLANRSAMRQQCCRRARRAAAAAGVATTRSDCSPRCARRAPAGVSRPERRRAHARRLQQRLLRARLAGPARWASSSSRAATWSARGGMVRMRDTSGERRVDVIYRRVDDEFLDPVQFRADSMLGCPGLLTAARAGNVTIANAVGNGVADDKLVYTYLPDLVRYYLGEEPVLPQRRHLAARGSRRARGGARPARRTRGQAGRRRRRQGPGDRPAGDHAASSTRCAHAAASTTRAAGSPSRSCSCRPCRRSSATRIAPRHVDLRPFAVNDGNDVWVLPGGLTRVALPEGSLVVNSSQGGGSKDTWVLAGERAPPAPRPSPRRRPDSHRRTLPTPGPTPRRRRDPASSSNSSNSSGGRAMLSRIAESLYWIGRYVERAEDTSRILDVHLQLLLDDPWAPEDVVCALAAVGDGRTRSSGR